jgi:hypothetical protein
MMLFVLSFAVFALAIAGMAIGVLLGRRPLAGSCGRDCGCRKSADD